MPAIYVTVGSNRLPEAKVFYDALIVPIGFRPIFEHPSGGRIYQEPGGSLFGVVGAYDKNPATVGNGAMFAFCRDSQAEVAALHAKALELGAVDEGAPGDRTPTFYAAYFRDLDGNKLCAYCLG
jgi:hypothetical protein